MRHTVAESEGLSTTAQMLCERAESDGVICCDCMQVLDAFTMLMGLKRLRSLSLVNNKGLATLPQLHPLLQLRKLSHLMLKDSPICSLVLLQPYVAFR